MIDDYGTLISIGGNKIRARYVPLGIFGTTCGRRLGRKKFKILQSQKSNEIDNL